MQKVCSKQCLNEGHTVLVIISLSCGHQYKSLQEEGRTYILVVIALRPRAAPAIIMELCQHVF